MEACTLINIFRLILIIFSSSQLFRDNLLLPSLVIASSAILEPSSPYYIHPNWVLVSFILDGSNYYSWARAMSLCLKMKNKNAFIKKPVAIDSPPIMEKVQYLSSFLAEPFSFNRNFNNHHLDH